jgi:hypothetical protein
MFQNASLRVLPTIVADAVFVNGEDHVKAVKLRRNAGLRVALRHARTRCSGPDSRRSNVAHNRCLQKFAGAFLHDTEGQPKTMNYALRKTNDLRGRRVIRKRWIIFFKGVLHPPKLRQPLSRQSYTPH